ncbi:hypothetical protein H0H93_015510 [Arthromyces matolae]|nr:hypothetical protein H0H93_015510 [Arthromyces matolae]
MLLFGREQGTVSKEKNEILFTRFQINYNEIDERFRKGSVLVREEIVTEPPSAATELTLSNGENATPVVDRVLPNKKEKKKRDVKPKTKVVVLHCDIIKDQFWDDRPSILGG